MRNHVSIRSRDVGGSDGEGATHSSRVACSVTRCLIRATVASASSIDPTSPAHESPADVSRSGPLPITGSVYTSEWSGPNTTSVATMSTTDNAAMSGSVRPST